MYLEVSLQVREARNGRPGLIVRYMSLTCLLGACVGLESSAEWARSLAAWEASNAVMGHGTKSRGRYVYRYSYWKMPRSSLAT